MEQMEQLEKEFKIQKLRRKYKKARNLFIFFLSVTIVSILGLRQCTIEDGKNYQKGMAEYEAQVAAYEADSIQNNKKLTYYEHLYEVAESKDDSIKMEQYQDSISAYSPPEMPIQLIEYGFGNVIFFVMFFIIIPNVLLALLFLIILLRNNKKYKKAKKEISDMNR